MARTSQTLYIAAASLLFGLITAQTPGEAPEVHPKLQTWKCTAAGGCMELNSAIVLDSLAHPVYQKDNPDLNCGEWGSGANSTVCPDEETCAQNCIMDGIDDYSAYGVNADGPNLELRMLGDDGSQLSPRVYLLEESEENYQMLQLAGNEFTFDVDLSKLPCGMNGALYLSEMEKDGALSELNPGGAAYGTGYCDAQCYATAFINGIGNIDGKGSCCNEMDIFEANSRASHIAPHPCSIPGLHMCEGDECEEDGICDKDGCSYNPYALGNHEYYGLNMIVDTTRPFSVVTQFPTNANGDLQEIHRLYIQDGKIIENAAVNIPGPPDVNFLNDEYCTANGADKYMDIGGTKEMGGALARGMVLALSIWWDESEFMQWLDGGDAGPCDATEGDPENIRKIQPDTAITFSNIKWGEIGSTYEQPSE